MFCGVRTQAGVACSKIDRTSCNDISSRLFLSWLLCSRIKLVNDVKVYEHFENDGWYEGKIATADAANKKYSVLYSDGTRITQSEAEVREWLDVRDHPEWKRLVAERSRKVSLIFEVGWTARVITSTSAAPKCRKRCSS